ncbi:MAG TPA: hypothetical protein VFD42_08420 [Chloroflexota bacterium]|nr:hypothetical protein [Chloroflexota bacterium]
MASLGAVVAPLLLWTVAKRPELALLGIVGITSGLVDSDALPLLTDAERYRTFSENGARAASSYDWERLFHPIVERLLGLTPATEPGGTASHVEAGLRAPGAKAR